ncbi:sugar phosphate isomerase/epimerase [bacterium]|nr:sugar phosphate isomerase/epimerase [bacterium]
MGRLKVGVMVESFRVGVREGVRMAKEVGADGIQVYTTRGEMAPENLSTSGRQDFLRYVQSQGLAISALCGDYGKGGFVNPEGLEQRAENTKHVFDLARDLGVSYVTTHIGQVPEDRRSREWSALVEVIRDVAAYGARLGCCFATETGPESGAHLRDFLKQVNSDGARVNYDPANMVMRGFDPVQGARDLKGFIVHTHAKDGVRHEDGTRKEVPLGEGQVPWDDYIAALDEAGYDGFYTVEREVGENPAADIRKAVAFLRRF